MAQTFVELADQMLLVTVAWALVSTHSGAQLGVVLTAWAIPRGLFMMFGGVVIDRTDRRLVGIGASVGIAAVVSVLATAQFMGQLPLILWVSAAVVLGLLDGVRIPIGYSLIPLVVPKDQVLDANRWSQLRMWMTLTLGPAVGGLLVGFAGVGTALAVIAVCYLCGGLAMARLPKLPVDRSEKTSVLTDLAAGFRLIKNHPTLRLILPVFAVVNLFVLGITAVGIPTLVKQSLGADARVLGLVAGSFGLGLVIGTVLMGRLPKSLTGSLAGLFTLFALSDLFLALTGLAPAALVACVTFALSGFFIGPASAIYQSVLQTSTPPEFLGRVNSVSRAISFGLEPASAVLVGGATRFASAGAVVLVGGLAATCVDMFALLRGRRLDALGEAKLPDAETVASR